MKEVKQHLVKSLENFLLYEKGDVINKLVKTGLETLMNLERSEFLNESNDTKNKGNGYYERIAKALTNQFKLRIPRDRLGLFRPTFLEVVDNEKQKIRDLAFNMYVKGMSTRDISDVIKDIFGQKYSATSVSNITTKFITQREEWQNKKLDKEYYFLYVDATYIPVRRDGSVEKEAFYIVLGLTKEFKREILGVYTYPTETSAAYQQVFSNLKKRGFEKCLLVIADGFNGIKKAMKEEFPNIPLQTCLFHKKKNLKPHIRAHKWTEFLYDFNNGFRRNANNYTKNDALKELELFLEKWSKQYSHIRNHFLDKDKKYFVEYLDFPPEIQTMIYTTNWIERVNKEIKKITYSKNSFPDENSAMNLVCAILMEKERKNWNIYPVSSFRTAKNKLDKMLREIS